MLKINVHKQVLVAKSAKVDGNLENPSSGKLRSDNAQIIIYVYTIVLKSLWPV